MHKVALLQRHERETHAAGRLIVSERFAVVDESIFLFVNDVLDSPDYYRFVKDIPILVEPVSATCLRKLRVLQHL